MSRNARNGKGEGCAGLGHFDVYSAPRYDAVYHETLMHSIMFETLRFDVLCGNMLGI
jgi:hypothetical protein